MANIGQKWRLAYGRGNNAHCENLLDSSPKIKKMTRVVHGFSLQILNSIWYRKMYRFLNGEAQISENGEAQKPGKITEIKKVTNESP